MNNPFVSIYCITYNHEQFIAQALEGFVMQQTNFDFEIVISDDCSTDTTRAIIEKYKEKYPLLFKDVSPSKNLGMMANAKHTLEACAGKYIALCEGDDFWTDPLKLRIKTLAFNLQLQHDVKFIDATPDVFGLYAASDVGVLSTLSEGFSNSLLEYI